MDEKQKRNELKRRKQLLTLGEKIRFGKLKKFLSRKPQQKLEILPAGQEPDQSSGQDRNKMETLFFILAVIAFLSLLFAVLSFTRPATQTISDDVNYQHLGFFSYSAAAPAGIYDTDTIQSGDPIFPNLTCSININFNYTLVAETIESVGGAYKIDAILAHPQSGWQRTFPLQAQTPFTGNVIDTQATMNLCDIVRLVESVEEVTSVRAGSYTLSITPQVQVTGVIAGRSLDSTFEPQLTFQYDRTQFFLVAQGEGIELLNPREANSLHADKQVPNTLSLFGAELSVPVLRIVSIIGTLLSLTGLVILGLQLENISRNHPETFVRMKYDPLIIDVEENNFRNPANAIDVSTIDDLAKLAEKHSAMILHETRGNIDNYLVHLDGISYAYTRRVQQPVNLNSRGFIRADLEHGLDRGEFEVHYQPIISLKEDHITAVEALLRWKHPQHGMLSAGDFIQTAESTGYIGELDEWVLQVACMQLKGWRDAGHDLMLAVNLSNYNLDREPAEFFQRILLRTNTDPSWLQVEISESNLTQLNPMVLPKLQKLKETGVQITIDNFTGEVGLSSISRMPVNSIKIDGFMVRKTSNPAGETSMQRMIAIADTLGLNVVGSGVETSEEKVFLARMGSQAQGYLLGRPVPAAKIIDLLQQNIRPAQSKPQKKRLNNVKDDA